jgi:sarcosine oxidase subunit beta
MMSETADILIIGGGVMGCSIAYHLARQRVGRITLLERQAICTGTTGRSGAIIRQHYSNDFTVRMARDSLRVFNYFSSSVGGDCGFLPTGMLVLVGEQGAEALKANVQMQRAQGVKTRLLTAQEVSQVPPGFSNEGIALACYEEEAGVADPMATTSCFARRAGDFGARLYEEVAVTRILTEGERITGVETTQGTFAAPVVVLAANAWSPALVEPLGIALPITATRHPMLVLRRPDDFGGRYGLHAVCLDLVRSIYLRPDLGGLTLVGSTENVLTPSNPDDYAQGLSEDEIRHFHTQGQQTLPPLARAVPRGNWAGIYDDTPDYHPILGALPPYTGLYCAVGFSGHGFKLSPIIGQWMAQLLLTGQAPADMHHFSYERFAQGQQIQPHYSSGVLG